MLESTTTCTEHEVYLTLWTDPLPVGQWLHTETLDVVETGAHLTTHTPSSLIVTKPAERVCFYDLHIKIKIQQIHTHHVLITCIYTKRSIKGRGVSIKFMTSHLDQCEGSSSFDEERSKVSTTLLTNHFHTSLPMLHYLMLQTSMHITFDLKCNMHGCYMLTN